MFCIYCAGKTTVINSRPQQRLRQTWRRRKCGQCGKVFSSIESADMSSSIQVSLQDGTYEPFARDKLYLSVAASLGHREDVVSASTALTATIIMKLLKTIQNASISRETIYSLTAATLAAFDTSAAVQYKAYHRRRRQPSD